MMEFPEQQAERYERALLRVANRLHSHVQSRAGDILNTYNEYFDTTGRAWDIDDPELSNYLSEVRAEMMGEIDDRALREIVATNLAGVKSAINVQFNADFERMVGIQPLVNDDRLEAIIQDRISENVDLIKTLPERHFDRIEGLVEKAVNEGWSTQRLEDALPRAGASAEFDTERIARDQIGSTASDLSEQRFKDAGVDSFIWVTSADERVRGLGEHDTTDHVGLDGHRFSWKDGSPLSSGGQVDLDNRAVAGWSESGYPGKDIQCRCVAQIPQVEIEGLQ